MRRECRAIPLHIQSIMMVFIGLDRIEEFLLLEELRLEKHEIPDDPERVALSIENGYFAWGEPI